MKLIFAVWATLLMFAIHSFSEGNWADGTKAIMPILLLTAVLAIVNIARRHRHRVVIEVHHL